MKIGNMISALLCVAIGTVFLYLSKDFPAMVSDAPGPGFYPSLLSWILILLGVILFIESLVSKKKQAIEISLKSTQAKFVYKICGIGVIYAVLLQFIGFIVATLLFVFVMSYVMGLKDYKILIIIPVVTTIGFVLVFESVFHVPLPTQIFF